MQPASKATVLSSTWEGGDGVIVSPETGPLFVSGRAAQGGQLTKRRIYS